VRHAAFARTARLVAPGGRLFIIAKAREEHEPPGAMPWSLTRDEIESFRECGLREDSIVEHLDDDVHSQVRRWRGWFTAPERGQADVVDRQG
jgi:hypothetical protein